MKTITVKTEIQFDMFEDSENIKEYAVTVMKNINKILRVHMNDIYPMVSFSDVPPNIEILSNDE